VELGLILDKVKKKYMETFSIVYLSICIVVLGFKLYRYVKGKKKVNNQETEPLQAAVDNAEPVKKQKDDLQYTYDTVNSWVNNCDQKAGILLTVVGVAMTILATSDFLKYLRAYIFAPFVKYWSEETELTFSWSRFAVFVLLLIAAAMLIASCVYLFKAISVDINYQRMRDENPGMVKKSYIFFGSINGMTFDDFKKEEVDYLDDMRSQIYVNSKIATAKFKNYSEGLYWFRFMLLVSAMLFVAIMFMK
jgi:hypothetical protein